MPISRPSAFRSAAQKPWPCAATWALLSAMAASLAARSIGPPSHSPTADRR
jgi:hypothetical protein